MGLIMPSGEAGAAAEYGTQLHAEGEELLTTAFRTGRLPIFPDAKDPQTQAMQAYVEYVFQQSAAGCDMTLEGHEVLTTMCSGTADAISIDEDFETVEVSDLKTGSKPVSPQSSQVGIYLAAVRRRLGPKYANFTYKGTISQFGKQESFVWSKARLDELVAEVEEVQQFVKDVILGKRNISEGFCASDSNCHWCPAAGCCEAQKQGLFTSMEGDGQEVFENAANGIATAWEAKTLTADRRASILKAAPKIKKWLDEVEAISLAEAKAGGVIPGFELGTKRQGARKWKDDSKAAVALLPHLKKQQIYQPKLISPAQAEKLGVSEETLDELTVRPEGKAALVPAKTCKPEELFD